MTTLFSRNGPLRWAVWFGVGVFWHLCAVLLTWLLARTADTSALNPLTYSDFGWFLTIAWYWGWLWLWVKE